MQRLIQRLLLDQQKQVKDAIERHGLVFAEFTWKEHRHFEELLYVPALVHSQTDCYFEFHSNNQGWQRSYYYPSENFACRVCQEAKNWEDQYRYFEAWLYIVTKERIAFDRLREGYGNEWAGPGFTEVDKGEYLSDEEQRAVSLRLLEFKKKIISNEEIKPSIKEHVGLKIDNLIDEISTLTKGQVLSRFMEAIQPAILNIGYSLMGTLLFETGKYLLK